MDGGSGYCRNTGPDLLPAVPDYDAYEKRGGKSALSASNIYCDAAHGIRSSAHNRHRHLIHSIIFLPLFTHLPYQNLYQDARFSDFNAYALLSNRRLDVLIRFIGCYI